MTEACRAYHSAVVAEESGGRSALLGFAPFVRLGRAGGAALFAGSVLATTYAASTVGIRRRDPGVSRPGYASAPPLLEAGRGTDPPVRRDDS